MKAAVLHALHEPLEIADVAEPTPGPDDLVVQVEAEGICRTDWHVWNGDWGWVGLTPTLPLVMGHELGGTVTAVGADVRKFKVGDRVTVPFHESCGRCSYCVTGRGNLCDAMQFLGLTHDGGYAERARIVNADFNCVLLPDDVDALTAAAIGCRYMTAYHAVVRQGALRPGHWVAVHGSGGVGLSAVQIASSLGGQVIAVDLDQAKLDRALEEGAVATINAGTQDVAAAIRDLTGGGADLSIGALGVSSLVQNAVMCLRKGGRLAQVGLTSQAEQGMVSLPIDHIIENEIEIVGSVGNPQSDYPALLNLVQRRVLRPSSIVGSTVALEDVSEVISSMTGFGTMGFSVVTSF
jgi:D-arabinose 1-dehydrogenase-like Zn-dependent alcohol dehydrogenase